MHNISRHQIKALTDQFAQAIINETSEQLLEKVRELYEKVILLHHHLIFEEKPKNLVKEEASNDKKQQIEKPKERELSVPELIQQIMESTPKVNPEVKNILKEETKDVDITEKKLEFKKTEEPLETKNLEPTISLEEELKDAISAEYAADLFEKAEKIEITKKSLNDSLSQVQLQIGLNDRIAFVKHLFNGSQADFNRVLSQLNSFRSEEQAKNFIENMVKPDYNWSTKLEYEERLITIIERKFL